MHHHLQGCTPCSESGLVKARHNSLAGQSHFFGGHALSGGWREGEGFAPPARFLAGACRSVVAGGFEPQRIRRQL